MHNIKINPGKAGKGKDGTKYGKEKAIHTKTRYNMISQMFAKDEGSKSKKEQAASHIMEQDLSDDEFQQKDFQIQEDKDATIEQKNIDSVAVPGIQEAEAKIEEHSDKVDAADKVEEVQEAPNHDMAHHD